MIGLLMLPFYTSWLSVEEYGLTDVITVYVTFLMGFVSCCIGESLFIFPKGKEKEEQDKYFSSGIVHVFVMFGVTAILFFLVELVFNSFQIKNSFVSNIWLIYFMLVSMVLQQVIQQFTRCIDKMVVYSVTGIVVTVMTAVWAFILIPKYAVAGYVWSMILAHFSAALFSFFASKSFGYFSIRRLSFFKLKEMLLYSVPLIPNGVMWWLVNSLNRPVMERYLGFHEIGVFAVANKFPAILSVVFTVFATSWQISVLEEFEKKDYSVFFNRVFKLVFCSLLMTLLFLTLCSKLIVQIFAKEAFFEAWMYIPLLTLGVFFSNVAGFCGVNFSAVKKSKYYFYSSIWGALTAIGMNFLLIPIFGLWGACMSVILSFVVLAISRMWYGWKYVKVENIRYYVLALLLISLIIVSNINGASPFAIALESIALTGYVLYLIKNDFKLLKSLIKKR